MLKNKIYHEVMENIINKLWNSQIKKKKSGGRFRKIELYKRDIRLWLNIIEITLVELSGSKQISKTKNEVYRPSCLLRTRRCW